MTGFNLSEWALKHRSFVVYLMLVATAAGLLSYFRLGRNEDPAFTFRTMVVQAAWPGATLEDTLDQITDRIEQTLKETPNLDFVRSFTRAGATTIFVTLRHIAIFRRPNCERTRPPDGCFSTIFAFSSDCKHLRTTLREPR